MNNNRNNRRRGRGNRKPNGGGGSQGNRIDSRARGNAPQLLDKYKKLAQDAQHNGDRVQAEYYLQFADHYFRVIADNNLRRDEQRGPRRFEEQDEDGEDEDFEEREDTRAEPRRRRDRSDEDGESDGEVERTEPGARFEPVDNPFVRRDEAPRTRKPRGRRPVAPEAGNDAGLDQSVLPPALGRRAENDTAEDAEGEAKPARRRRRKPEEGSAVAAE